MHKKSVSEKKCTHVLPLEIKTNFLILLRTIKSHLGAYWRKVAFLMVNPIARMEIYKFGIVHASSHLSKCPNLDDKMNMYTCIVWHRWLDCSGSHWCQTIPNNTRLGCNHFIFGQVDTWKLPTKILQSFHPYGPIHHVRCHFFIFFDGFFLFSFLFFFLLPS